MLYRADSNDELYSLKANLVQIESLFPDKVSTYLQFHIRK